MDYVRSFFPRKEPDGFIRLQDTYSAWYDTLKKVHQKDIKQSIKSNNPPDQLEELVTRLHEHINSLYQELERHVDHDTIIKLLSTSWHSSLESPFLFLGDIHPIIFTNVLKSLMYPATQGDMSYVSLELERSAMFVNAWKDPPSDQSRKRLETIECRIDITVCALLTKMRCLQKDYVAKTLSNWISSRRNRSEEQEENEITKVIETTTTELTAELQKILIESYPLRTSIVDSILEMLNEHQATLYFENLVYILLGYKNQVRFSSFSFSFLSLLL
ncbi:hypothetical protein CARUB_v10028587mg [Capsella rubella]|uniref:DOG1 domain-containing protein n=1 Tax=Capsella rubella TaxID=81985 RepID=R0ETR6_9BRAS|nr:hypothetical protein CARUB_v10028587mg [Capsella rubella]